MCLDDVGCGGELNVTSSGTVGYFASKNYPNLYDNQLKCTWHISAPPGENIKLTFSNFTLEQANENHECGYDYVEVSAMYAQYT